MLENGGADLSWSVSSGIVNGKGGGKPYFSTSNPTDWVTLETRWVQAVGVHRALHIKEDFSSKKERKQLHCQRLGCCVKNVCTFCSTLKEMGEIRGRILSASRLMVEGKKCRLGLLLWVGMCCFHPPGSQAVTPDVSAFVKLQVPWSWVWDPALGIICPI